MSHLIPSDIKDIVAAIQRGEIDLPKPFAREIYLFTTQIAGTNYIDDIVNIEPTLELDDLFDFFREPNNKFDKQAIVIRTNQGKKIGYVPRSDNVVFARLMDAGKLLYGKLTDKKWQGDWLKLTIDVYLNE